MSRNGGFEEVEGVQLRDIRRRDSIDSDEMTDRKGVPRKQARPNSSSGGRDYEAVPSNGGGPYDPAASLKRWESAEDVGITIHQAARDGDVGVMERLLQQLSTNKKRKINALDENNQTALHYAARYNHLPIVTLLVSNGANLHKPGDDDLTALHFAARYKRTRVSEARSDGELSNDSQQYVDIEVDDGIGGRVSSVIEYLEKKGADVNVKDIYGSTPLHFAAMRGNEVAAADLLQCKQINIEAVDKQQLTPLHNACIHGVKEVAELLISAGANIRCKDEDDSTPLHFACTEGHEELVKLLFAAAKKQGCISEMLRDVDNEDNTPLHLAVDSGHEGVVDLCLSENANVNCRRKDQDTPLHSAAVAGNPDIVKKLLAHNARIDAVNKDHATALHRACQFNRSQVVEYLIKKRARIERKDKDNFTPLLIAACYGHATTIEILLKYKAKITATDKQEKSVFYLAAEEEHYEALQALLKHPRAKSLLEDSDRYDNGPLHIAAKFGYLQIVKLLIENGADIDAKNEEEQTPAHLAALYGKYRTVKELVNHDPTVVDDEDEYSNTPLHLASQEGHFKVVQVLIAAGAEITARNQNQWTPLDCAASNGWRKTAEVLLEADCPVDPIDKAKTTPLHLACKNGHLEVVKLLLEWKASLSLKDIDNKNCLDLAIENSKKDVAMAIVTDDNWRDALRTEHKHSYFKWRTTPIRKLIQRMPDVAEVVFSNCSITNDLPPEHPDFQIDFDYEFLDDMFFHWDVDISGHNTASSDGTSQDDDGPYKENGRLRYSAVPYTYNAEVLRKNHPLNLMVVSKRTKLLGHPLVLTLLTHKWDCYGRYFYYLSLLIYIVFLFFLTGYIITTPPPFYHLKPTDQNCTDKTYDWLGNGEKRWVEDSDDWQTFLFGELGDWIIVGLAAFHLLKEIIQLWHQKFRYLTINNLIEWIVYILAVLLVVPLNDCLYENNINVKYDWQWQCGAVAILLAWINLILFIQKLPRLGIYVVMFTDVLKTFLQFSFVFLLFIIAFSLGFYTLLMNQEPFNTVWYAFVKTFVMMIGEFEFDTTFHSQNYLDTTAGQTPEEDFLTSLYYKQATYVVFTIFAVIMSIILMNLLVGLAVDDIKEVQNQAKLQRLAKQVDLALEIEEALPLFFWRKYCVKKRRIRPNKHYGRTLLSRFFYGLLSSEASMLEEAISSTLASEKTVLEEVRDSQEGFSEVINNIKYRMKLLKSQNDRIEGMLSALLKNDGVVWDDGNDNAEEVGE
ncbi:transient receptor potential cation channel subfamily A member 1 homolog isoform X1 [Anneissia japonica]|uniref:transient receptor potential cation channel subfamily A member 1 homolog isoform X1 n=1 Tax=Anneissia japonica TaxID=1529436 RepID=UPI0014257F9F|nr:transient receptor potential cation channel subfamily A member 1 homolog isoform X1 [Anneissia japonica]